VNEETKMNHRSCTSSLALLIVGTLLTLAQPASANTESCTRAHATGQREENAGHLKEALASFQDCASDAECPLPIRNECTQLYTTVEGRLPTLVFSLVDSSGNDVVDVKAWSGDALIASGLDGRPVAVNPGLHELRFELSNGEVVTKSVVVRQGEKDRIVSLQLPRNDLGSTEPASVGSEQAASSVAASGTTGLKVPLGSWIAYGVGVAALGAWGTFALLGRNEDQSLDKCSPNCPSTLQKDYDAMKRDYMIADISLGVAGAAAVAGTVILLTMGRRSKAPADGVAAVKTRGSAREQTSTGKPSLSLSPALGRASWGLTLAGRY
jgi:hypothetical protein